jgi:hypothetical protein
MPTEESEGFYYVSEKKPAQKYLRKVLLGLKPLENQKETLTRKSKTRLERNPKYST